MTLSLNIGNLFNDSSTHELVDQLRKRTSEEEILEFERKFEYATELMDDMVNDLDDLLASGATIEELANDTEMELKKTSFNLKNDLEGLEATSEFKIEASKLSLEDYPTLLNSSNGDLFAIRLDAINPPTLQALEKVEAQVKTDWKEKETIKERLFYK